MLGFGGLGLMEQGASHPLTNRGNFLAGQRVPHLCVPRGLMSAILWTTRGNFLAGQRVSQWRPRGLPWPDGSFLQTPRPHHEPATASFWRCRQSVGDGVLPPQGPQWGSMRNVPVCFPVPFGADGETRVEVLEPPLHLARAHGMTDDEHLRAWAVRHIRHMYGHSEATRSIATIKNKAARVPPVWLPPPSRPSPPRSTPSSDHTRQIPCASAPCSPCASGRSARSACQTRSAPRPRHWAVSVPASCSAAQCSSKEGGNPRVNRRPNLAGQCRQCHDVVSHAVNVLVMLCECYTNSEFVPEPPATLGTFAETVIRELTRVRFAHPLYAIAWFDHVGTTVLRASWRDCPTRAASCARSSSCSVPPDCSRETETGAQGRGRERQEADTQVRRRFIEMPRPARRPSVACIRYRDRSTRLPGNRRGRN